jgi:hypothetical protein
MSYRTQYDNVYDFIACPELDSGLRNLRLSNCQLIQEISRQSSELIISIFGEL